MATNSALDSLLAQLGPPTNGTTPPFMGPQQQQTQGPQPPPQATPALLQTPPFAPQQDASGPPLTEAARKLKEVQASIDALQAELSSDPTTQIEQLLKRNAGDFDQYVGKRAQEAYKPGKMGAAVGLLTDFLRGFDKNQDDTLAGAARKTASKDYEAIRRETALGVQAERQQKSAQLQTLKQEAATVQGQADAEAKQSRELARRRDLYSNLPEAEQKKRTPSEWMEFFETGKFPAKGARDNTPTWTKEGAVVIDNEGQPQVLKDPATGKPFTQPPASASGKGSADERVAALRLAAKSGDTDAQDLVDAYDAQLTRKREIQAKGQTVTSSWKPVTHADGSITYEKFDTTATRSAGGVGGQAPANKDGSNAAPAPDSRPGGEKPIIDVERTKFANAESGLKAVAEMRTLIKQDPKKLLLAAIPGSLGARDFNAARSEAIDVLARLRTGAVINEEEEKLYKRQFPNALDLTDPKVVTEKLDRYEALMKRLVKRSNEGAASSATGPATLEEYLRKKREGAAK